MDICFGIFFMITGFGLLWKNMANMPILREKFPGHIVVLAMSRSCDTVGLYMWSYAKDHIHADNPLTLELFKTNSR